MSQRDSHLLELADLSAAEAAILLGKSRAALYQGIGQARNYLSSPEALVILQHLKSVDSARVTYVHDYIESNFEESERNIILSDYVDFGQISSLASISTEIMVLLNGSMIHLDKNSTVMQFILSVSENSNCPLLIAAPVSWIFDYIGKEFRLRNPAEFQIDNDLAYLPCCAGTLSEKGVRMFIFGKSGAEEIVKDDAEKIWMKYRPIFNKEIGKKIALQQ
jgi:hypothetical protein